MNTGLPRYAVATAPTVYGIETHGYKFFLLPKSKGGLQQHLPFTVLKLNIHAPDKHVSNIMLQQHLPFTVLKLSMPPSRPLT